MGALLLHAAESRWQMASFQQKARARLGEDVDGFEIESVEDTDVLTSRFSARGREGMSTICILHARLTHLPGFASGFNRAAWHSKNVGHRCIPRLLSAGTTRAGEPYTRFEHVGGETLRDYLKRRTGTVPPAEALRITAELAEAVDAAHQQGVVHGAIQPDSIALKDDGSVRLLNLGWSRLREQAAAHVGLGAIPGSVVYMSPNQARGELPSEADDIWGVASLLFELLSGRRLRSGASDQEIATRAAMEPAPKLSELIADAPTEFVELLEHALHPEPGLRAVASELATRCRELSDLPAVSGLQQLAGAVDRISLVEATGEAGPSLASGPPPNQSQVSSVAAVSGEATGTAEVSGDPSHGGSRAGAYSAFGVGEVETLRPKKPL